MPKERPLLPGFIMITHGDEAQYHSLINVHKIVSVHVNSNPGKSQNTTIYTGPDDYMSASETFEEIMLLMAVALH